MGMGRIRNVLSSAVSGIKDKISKQNRPEALREAITQNQLNEFLVLASQIKDPSEFATLAKLAVQHGRTEMLKKMQELGVDFSEKDTEENTLLHLAVANADAETVDFLADVISLSERNTAGDTPLILALKMGHIDIVNRLLDKHPELLTTPDQKGNLLLHEAARAGHLAMVNLLIKRLEQAHADELGVNVQNRSGETLLHLAARHGHLPLAQELVKMGAEIGTTDYERNTPLHLAAMNGHANVVSFLTEHLMQHFHAQSGGAEYDEVGKYVNAKNKAGNTPLHLAVLRSRKNAAYALVRRGGAKIDIPNEENELPLDIIEDPIFKKDLAILAKTGDSTEDGILINKNISDELEQYLEAVKLEKLEMEKSR